MIGNAINNVWCEFTSNRERNEYLYQLLKNNRTDTTTVSTDQLNTPSTTIIGAGLCGLAIAYRLQQAGIGVTVLEANTIAGGRIQPAGKQTGHQDLGPTWVWPYAQPVVNRWLTELGLSTFEQFDEGLGLLDRDTASFATRQMLPSQHGIARINGGTHALIRQLEKNLPVVVQYDQTVTGCTLTDNGWQLSISTPVNPGTGKGKGASASADADADADASTTKQLTTDRLIIATPPRLAAAMLNSDTNSLADVLAILQASETWMAPHAKIVAFYDNAFWREAGLSGRIASQVGPLVEVHDHSGPDGMPAALFGFSGVPASARAHAPEQFIEAIKVQLQRCFGDQAPAPTHIEMKDWAFEPFTTTEADRTGSGAHPPVLSKIVRQSHGNESLWFAGSETSASGAGLIEGALVRADEVAEQCIRI